MKVNHNKYKNIRKCYQIYMRNINNCKNQYKNIHKNLKNYK